MIHQVKSFSFVFWNKLGKQKLLSRLSGRHEPVLSRQAKATTAARGSYRPPTDTAVGGWLYERAQTMRFAVQPACATVSVFGDFCPKIIFHSKGS